MYLLDAFELDFPTMISAVGGGGKTRVLYCLARELRDRGRSVLLTTTTAVFHPRRSGQAWDSLVTGTLPARRPRSVDGRGELVVGAHAHDPDTDKLCGYDPVYLDGLRAADRFDAILVEADGARGLPVKAPAGHEPVVPSRSDGVIGVIGLDCLGRPLTPVNVHRLEAFARVTGLEPGAPITAEALVRLVQAPSGLFKGVGAAARRMVLLNKADSEAVADQGRVLAGRMLRKVSGVDRILVASLLGDGVVKAVLKSG